MSPLRADGFVPVKVSGADASRTLSSFVQSLSSSTGTIQSDEFDSTTLDTSIWTFVDPVGDATLNMTGTHAEISVPAGTRHDLWTNVDEVPRLLQAAPDGDLEVEVKWDSAVSAQYQLQGLLVVQDADDMLRVETHHDGGGTQLFVAKIVAGTASTIHYGTIAGGAPVYFRLAREGDSWTLRYSGDGSGWATGATFTHPLAVTAIGPFAGNSGSTPPAFTSRVDYFRSIAPPPADTTSPAIGDIQVATSAIGARVTWTTDEPATSAVAYGTDTSYSGGTVGSAALVTSHSLTLSGLACGTVYHFEVRSRDEAGNEAASGDQIFTTGACPTAISSDEFNSGSLNTSLWTFVDPVGDASLVMTASHAEVSVPAGTRHDLWTNADEVPRLLQAAPNADFEVEVKFDSAVSAQYQLQGLLVVQDADDLLRIETHYDGAVRLFVARIAGGTASTIHHSTVGGDAPSYLRVVRAGDSWTVLISSNGSDWVAGATFTQALALSAIGPFAGNSGSPPPAFTSRIDYFRDVPPDVTAPQIAGISVAPGPIAAQVAWTTDEPATSRIDYGTTASYGSTTTGGGLATSHELTLTGLSCATTYHYMVRSADGSGNEAASGDLTFTTAACPSSLVSDEFDSTALDLSRWTYVDPVGDTSISMSGTHAVISLPAGSRHDLWTGADEVPKLLQAAPDEDFEVEVKFDTAVTSANQMEGLVVQQDAANLLRFEVHSDGDATRLFVAEIVDGAASTIHYSTVPSGAPLYLRLKRKGATWTFRHSIDGQSWTSTSFTRTLTVRAVGLFAGNSGASPPAFQATVDYFRYIPPDVTPPQISGVSPTPGAISAEITWTTDEPASSTVAYGPTSAYENGTVEGPGGVQSHRVLLHGLRCETAYHYQVRSVDGDGNEAASTDSTFTTAVCPTELTSDEFDTTALDTGLWAFFNPLGDATANANGSQAVISVPDGTTHDVWTDSDTVPRLLQAVPEADFEVEAKFDSVVSTRYQQQGIIVEQDAQNLLRFEVHFDGSETRFFVASISGDTATVRYDRAVSGGVPAYLRVERKGQTWTARYSTDGESWAAVARFDQAFAPSAIGPYAGNGGGSPPAFAAMVDYFRALPPPPPDLTPPQLTSIAALPHRDSSIVTWSTNEPSTATVEWGATAEYGQSATTGAAAELTAHRHRLTGLTCSAEYHYRVRSTDAAGNESVSADQTFTTAPCADGPHIAVWRGDSQTFGVVGVPQRWVNILGNVDDPDGISSLSYRLNAGDSSALNVGPADYRLVHLGDFNIEIDHRDLLPGSNDVAINAVDTTGNSTVHHVVVDWQGSPETAWPMPYTAQWTSTASIPQLAQIIDGQWAFDGSGIRPVSTGFDRLVTLGDMTWTDYEVTAHITYNSFDKSDDVVGTAVGLAVGWQGHSDSWGQPRFGHPSGGYCFYEWNRQDPDFKLQIAYSPGPADDTTMAKVFLDLPLGVPLSMRFRERDLGTGATRYSCKIWPSDSLEPAAWTLEADIPYWEGETGTHPGSVVLVAHNADATFGEVTIAPVGD